VLAKDADTLKVGDKIVTFNGPYIQHGFVTGVTRGKGSIRWIEYKWRPPGTLEWKFGCKRHVSVYLPKKKPEEA